jgi:hypothetical protein
VAVTAQESRESDRSQMSLRFVTGRPVSATTRGVSGLLAVVEYGKHQLAAETYERWVKTVLEAGVPEPLQGFMLYNLACFYATYHQGEKAWAPLQQSYTLYPLLREVALTDADLVELHLIRCRTIPL